MTDSGISLTEGMRQLDLGFPALWDRYVVLGGSGDIDDLRDHVHSDTCPDDHEHNVIAQALNDTFLDRGGDHPVAYQHLYQPD